MKKNDPCVIWTLEPKVGLDLPLVLEAGFEVFHKARASSRGLHAHDGFEMDYMLEGELDFDFGNKRVISLYGGHFLLIPPHIRHRIRYDVVTPCRVFWISVDPLHTHACRNTPFTRKFLRWTCQKFLAAGITTRRADKEFASRFNRLDSLLKSTPSSPADRLAIHEIRLLLCQLWLSATRLLGPEANRHPSPIIERARRFLDENIGTETDITRMAQNLNISLSHLTRAFLEETGYTPADYLRRLRCARAKEMLLSTSYSVTRIAMDLGFSTSQRFAEVFRKYTGMSPSLCRKSAQR